MQGDYDEPDESTESEPSYPVKVRIAAILWIVIGSVILLPVLKSFIFIVNAGNAAAVPIGGIGLGLFGVAVIFGGYQTLKGTAKDILGNARGSIGLGLICLAYVGYVLIIFGTGPLGVSVGVVYLPAGLTFLGAGVLALVGREDYKTWWRWNKRRAASRED